MKKVLNKLIRSTKPLGKTIMGEWVEWQGKWYFVMDNQLQLYKKGKVRMADLIEKIKNRCGHKEALSA